MTNKTIIPNSPSARTEVLCVDNGNKDLAKTICIYIYIINLLIIIFFAYRPILTFFVY